MIKIYGRTEVMIREDLASAIEDNAIR